MTIRLITWNVNRRVTKLPDQMAVLHARTPDIIALQEVTGTTEPLWREQFHAAGYPFVISGIETGTTSRNSRNVLLIASRWQITPQPAANLPTLTRPDALLSVVMQTPFGKIEVTNIHIPTAANGLDIKIGVVDALYQWLAINQPPLRIVCGDFNMPRLETPTGELITFGQRLRKDGTWAVRDPLEDRIERQIIHGLAAFDLPDVFRAVNGFLPRDTSWIAWNRGRGFGFRLDHIFASRYLHPVECRYHHTVRETGLSDHSALEAAFQIPGK